MSYLSLLFQDKSFAGDGLEYMIILLLVFLVFLGGNLCDERLIYLVNYNNSIRLWNGI